MKNILNILHYSIYKMHYKSHLIANKVNPFNLIHKLPFQKSKYEELDIDIQKETDKAFQDEKYGLSIMISGGVLLSIILTLLVSLGLILEKTFDQKINIKYLLLISGLISYLICYFTVFKNDRYLEYFRTFKYWPKKKTNFYIVLSSLFICGVIVLFFKVL